MAYKNKKQREEESRLYQEEIKSNFLKTREMRFFKLLQKMGENTDIFSLPVLTFEIWDDMNFNIVINAGCPYRSRVVGDEYDSEHYKFYDSEENFSALENEVNSIISGVRSLIDEAQRKELKRQNALNKLSEEEKELLGVSS